MNINSSFQIAIGWVLLIIGMAIIGQTIFDSYRFFTAKAEFPAVFEQSAAKISPIAAVGVNSGQDAQAMAQAQIQKSVDDAVSRILPQESINKTLNMAVWLAFAWFLVYAGAKICGIGIKLMSSKV